MHRQNGAASYCREQAWLREQRRRELLRERGKRRRKKTKGRGRYSEAHAGVEGGWKGPKRGVVDLTGEASGGEEELEFKVADGAEWEAARLKRAREGKRGGMMVSGSRWRLYHLWG